MRDCARRVTEEGHVGNVTVTPMLPTGTVTFLLHRCREFEPALAGLTGDGRRGDPSALRRPRRAGRGARRVLPLEQGEGDSIVAAFGRPSNAVAAAIEMQRTLAVVVPDLRVRMAIHTGEAQLRDERNDMGDALIRCARLRAAAHGGQVVISDVVGRLAGARLPAGAGLRDLGVHRLRDISLSGAGVAARPRRPCRPVPPPRTLDQFRHNLPAAATPLVGRVAELAEIAELVLAQRLVTVTGAGGVGKL